MDKLNIESMAPSVLGARYLSEVASRRKAQQREKEYKAALAKACIASGSIDIDWNGKTYEASLVRANQSIIDVRKLYTLALNGEITLDDFLSLITPPTKEEIEEKFGTDTAEYLLSDTTEGRGKRILSVKEKKNDEGNSEE